MKRVLQTLFAGAALLSATTASAQLPDGSVAPNFTLTDLGGSTHTLSSYLAAGKTVFIDCSATWCGPCWAYHNSGALEELYLKHGPTGTCSQDVIVLYIEGDASTTIADLNGTGTNTQGNWVAGTPYPIIDAGASSFTTDYDIAYFPTIYKVCPNGLIYEVGQLNAEGLESSVSSCGFTLDADVSQGPTVLQCTGTFAPQFTFKNSGSTTLTSSTIEYSFDGGTPSTYNFAGSLAAGATTVITLPSTTLSAGSHTMEVHIMNANGGADGNRANNCKEYTLYVNSAAAAATPLTQNFATTGFPYAEWILNNPDGGITWARMTTSGGTLKYDAFNYGSAGQIDEFYVQPVDLTGITAPVLSFDVAYRPYNASYWERLEVHVSSDCGATWTSVYNKANTTLQTVAAGTSAFTPTSTQWRNEVINLPGAFAGDGRVYVKFKATNGYGNNLWLDNINIQQATSVVDLPNAEFYVNVYPNPVTDMATLNVDLPEATPFTVTVTNSVGQVVFTKATNGNAGTNNVALDFAGVTNGMYFVTVNANNKIVTTKITK